MSSAQDAGRQLLAAFFAAHLPWLRAVLGSRYGVDRAEDLTQETWVRVAQHTAEIRYPKAFLLRVAVNIARDQHRRAMVRGGGNTVAVEALFESEAPSVDGDQFAQLFLKQIVLCMPRLYRDVFILSRFEGLSYEEIAARLRLPVKTIEWRMTKALAYCAEQLRD